MFHISQLKKCLRVPTDAVDLETLDLQPGLTYEEHPITIFDSDERKVKHSMVKFVKVQWSNHTEDEATWEREDRLRQDYPDFFSQEVRSLYKYPHFLNEIVCLVMFICGHNHHQRNLGNVLPHHTAHKYIIS